MLDCKDPTRLTYIFEDRETEVGQLISVRVGDMKYGIVVVENKAATVLRPLYIKTVKRILLETCSTIQIHEGMDVGSIDDEKRCNLTRNPIIAGQMNRRIPRNRPQIPSSRGFCAGSAVYEAVDILCDRRLESDDDNEVVDDTTEPLIPAIMGILPATTAQICSVMGIKKVAGVVSKLRKVILEEGAKRMKNKLSKRAYTVFDDMG